MESHIEQLTEILETLFIPILLIEAIWLGRKGGLSGARLREMLANASALLFVVPAGFVGLLLWSPVFGAAAALVPWTIPTTGWSVVLAVLVADFIYYWEHRFEHEHRLPWALYHSVHHSSPHYDQTTSLRLGLFDGLLTLGFTLPMVMMGFSATLALLASGLVVGYQTWIHTEVVGVMPRGFEWIFNTPSHHRAHHGADAPYLDVNYGGILIVWDRLFGTFQSEVSRPRYGLTTPIDSSHPLDVQFSQLQGLWKDLKADRSWKLRLTRLWRRPDWQPDWQPDRPPVKPG